MHWEEEIFGDNIGERGSLGDCERQKKGLD